MTTDKYLNLTGAAELVSKMQEYVDNKNISTFTNDSGYLTADDIIINTVSGEAVVIRDAIENDPINTFQVEINPILSGSGTAAPDNVRNITGHATVKLSHGNKNIFNGTGMEQGSFSATTGANTNSTTRVRYAAPFYIPPGTYTFSCATNEQLAVYVYDLDNNWKSAETNTGWTTGTYTKTILPERKINIVYSKTNGATVTPSSFTANQIEVNSLASTYAIPIRQEYNITLPDTIYKGKLNLLTGELTVTGKKITLDGSEDEDWALTSSSAWAATNTIVAFSSAVPDNLFVADSYNTYNAIYYCNRFLSYSRNGLVNNDVNGICFADVGRKPTIRILKTLANDLTTFKTWLANNPVEIVYELATPITYQLTLQQIELLTGINTFLSDCGPITIDYKPQTKSYIANNSYIYPVKGTQVYNSSTNAKTGAWTGNIDIDHLYDGLTIAYYLPMPGNGNATLNLTLSDGTTTGPVDVYYTGASRMTTHYTAGSTILLTYWSAGSIIVSGNVTTNNRWTHGDYSTETAYNIRKNQTGYLAAAQLYRYMLCFTKGEDSLQPANTTSNSTGTSKTLTDATFNPFGQIYYYSSTTAVNAGSAISSAYLYATAALDLRYSFNTGQTLTANKAVYVVCDPQSDGTAKFATTTSSTLAVPMTQDLPTTEDGKIYIYLGQAYSTYQVELALQHPIYEYKNGKIKLYVG